MSASRRCSTASSARSWRSSTTGPASPATGARARRGSATLRFRIIDTAGLEEAEAGSLLGRMRAQTEAAIAEADVVLFLIDARAGVLPADRPFAELVRRSGKPVILVANKAEGGAGMAGRLRRLLARPRRSGAASRPSTARAWPTCSTRLLPHVREPRGRGRRRRGRGRPRTSRSRSPSSAGRTPASRR